MGWSVHTYKASATVYLVSFFSLSMGQAHEESFLGLLGYMVDFCILVWQANTWASWSIGVMERLGSQGIA